MRNIKRLRMEHEEYLECGRTLLQEAIYTKNYEEAKRLIMHGADVSRRTMRSASSLHLACQNETYDVQLVEWLLEKGCPRDPNALDAACSAGHLPLVRVMHKYDVPLQDSNCSGWNGFCYAVENFHSGVVYFLLNHYPITQEMMTRGHRMRITHMSYKELPGPRYGFIRTNTGSFPLWSREEWCRAVDVYFAVTEQMLTLPENMEVYNLMARYLDHFRKVRTKVRAWCGVIVKMVNERRMDRNVGRHIGWYLWNTRFECIPLDGEVFHLEM